MHRKLEPKLLTILRDGYTRKQFNGDLLGGLTVGVVALPLSIALAVASGVKPEQGLYTAIFAGFVIAVLGGSRAQISGPTGAFIVIVYGIVQKYGYDGLVVATLIAGVLLVIMGLARMGAFLKFVPYPVIVGFTSAIALIISPSMPLSSPEAWSVKEKGASLDVAMVMVFWSPPPLAPPPPPPEPQAVMARATATPMGTNAAKRLRRIFVFIMRCLLLEVDFYRLKRSSRRVAVALWAAIPSVSEIVVT